MAKAYCGNDCELCQQKEQLNCPGCYSGPGNAIRGDCYVADCCRRTGHNSCATCKLRLSCESFGAAAIKPEERFQQHQARIATRQRIGDKAPMLALCFRLLLLMIIPDIASTLLKNINGMELVCSVLDVLIWLGSGVILLVMASAEKSYQTAGIFTIAGGVLSVVVQALKVANPQISVNLPLSIVADIVYLLGVCAELHAHKALLLDLKDDLAQSWVKLWTWYLAAFLALLLGLFLTSLQFGLGIVITLVGVVASLIVFIVKLVYLSRSAGVFIRWNEEGNEFGA